MNDGFYVKFDLTRASLAALTDLSSVARREEATRVSVIAAAPSLSRLDSEALLQLETGLEMAAIKAPTIDGTELWLIESGVQAEFEAAVGFGKTSTPLLILPSNALQGLAVKHPIRGEGESRIEVGTGVSVHAEEASHVAGFEARAIRAMEDAGTLVLRRGSV